MSRSSPHRASTSAPPRPRPLLLVLAHWLTAALLMAAALTVLLRAYLDGDTLRKGLLAVHQQVGLFVLAVVVLRMWMRLRIGRPTSAPTQPAWQRWSATIVHGGLYVAVSALPLLGWAASNARGEALSWLGLPLPRWIDARDLDLADELVERHAVVAWILLALVAVHAGAALWHHFVIRDDMLVQMWPWRRRHPLPISTTPEEKT